jgi:hypothetical protein
MAIELHRLNDVRLGFVRPQGLTARPSASTISTAASLVVRGLLVGVGVATLAMGAGSAEVASISVLGVLALGAALLSWDP